MSPTNIPGTGHMTALTDPITHPLTAIRVRRGWSQAKVATVIRIRSKANMGSHRNKVFRWEKGLASPETPAQYALADELGVAHPVVDELGWPGWLLTVDREEPVDGPWSSQAAGAVLDSVVSSALMDRRAFISTTAGALVAMATAWQAAPAEVMPGHGRGAVTLDAVGHLQRRVEELWRLDDALGGGGCLEAGVADLRLVSTLVRTRRYDPEVGTQLYRLAGALSRFCGWAAFDAGRINAAQRFWHAGLRTAASAGDADQGVYAMSNLALAAVYSGDAPTALHLLELARTRVDPSARVVLSMLECWSSRAIALTGDAAATAAALNRADDLWANRRAGDDPDWVYWMPQPSLTAEAATALMHTGDLAAAEANLQRGLAGAADAGPRDRTLYLARLAETQLRGGRLDQAADTAHTALDLGAGVDSERVRGRVIDVIELIPRQERRRAELVEHLNEAWAA